MLMELQLGLALPINSSQGFDLNTYGFKPKDVSGSEPSSRSSSGSSTGPCLSNASVNADYCNSSKKRGFDEGGIETLPLFLWGNNQPEIPIKNNSYSSTIDKSDGGEGIAVGWPPIKSCRRKICNQNRSLRAGKDDSLVVGVHGGDNSGSVGGGGSKSTYVKVKMEGVAIARKVNLSLHHSYQMLMDTVLGMFGSGQENVKACELTYQDREGDWLLAGDVPWSSFIQSVQRLKLLRSCD